VTGPEDKPQSAAKHDLACLEEFIAQSAEGAVIRLADDGTTALTARVGQDVEVTLMDVQMPAWMVCKPSLQFGSERRLAEAPSSPCQCMTRPAAGPATSRETWKAILPSPYVGSRKLLDTIPRVLLRRDDQNGQEKDHVAPA
jgi:hypothetical protein